LALLSTALGSRKNLENCAVSLPEFKKAHARLNKFRGHIGGSARLSLEGIEAILLYLLLLAGLSLKEEDRHWVRDSAEEVEPVLNLLTEHLLLAVEKKLEGDAS